MSTVPTHYTIVARPWGTLECVGLLWPPLVVSAFVCVLLVVPPQMQEVYRSLLEGHNWPRAILAFFSLGCAAYTISVAAQAIVASATLEDLESITIGQRIFLSGLITILGLEIPFALAYALYKTAKAAFILAPSAFTANRILADLQGVTRANSVVAARLRMAAAMIMIISVILAFALRRTRKLYRIHTGSFHTTFARFLARHWMASSLFCILVFVFFSFLFASTSLPATVIGTIPVLSLFIIVSVVFLSTIRIGYYKADFSPIAALLIVAVLLSIFGWSDNHLEPTSLLAQPKSLLDASGAFQEWLGSRADRAYFTARKQPYPVIIVAAQGGGTYAAAQAALFLSRMQDRCPNFSQHIFAISSVSGGTIGSAFFASLPSDVVKNQSWQECRFAETGMGPLESQARRFVGSDLLSSVIAAALFSDLLQRFLPFRIGSTDRGKALDRGLELAWSNSEQTGSTSPFNQMFLERWNPTSAAPALIINTTDVGNGRRVLISPFAINPIRLSSDSQLSWLYETSEMREGLATSSSPVRKDDLRLSQAAGISARFPWLLPAAEVVRGKETLQLVDGGYFDNSGIESAFDLIEDLAELPGFDQQNPEFRVHLVLFTGFQYDAPQGWRGLGDLLTPVRALLSSRESRGAMSYNRLSLASYLGCLHPSGCLNPYEIHTAATLDQEDLTLALALQMSNNSLDLIQAEIGDPHKCSSWNPPDGPAELKRLVNQVCGNSVTACEMQGVLGDNRCKPAANGTIAQQSVR
jgi:hypothetical protein